MATRWGTVGKLHCFTTTDWNRREDLYPVAYVYNLGGNLLVTLPLPHIAKAHYCACWQPDVEGCLNIVVITYLDAIHTQEDPETQREGWTLVVNNVENAIVDLSDGGTPISQQVWDAVLPSNHDLPNSAGLYLQVVRQNVLNLMEEIKLNATHGLAALEQKIMTNRSVLTTEINQNEIKINNLSAQSASETGLIRGDISDLSVDVSNANSNIDSSRNQIIAEINENEIKIDQVFNAIQHIQNTTRFMAVVPPKMIRPATGTKRYQFFLGIYDQLGNPEAPDSSPKVRIIRSDGVEILPETTMTQDSGKVGQYFYNYDVNAGTSEYVLRIEFKIIEQGETIYVSRVSEILEYDTSLAIIENKIDLIDSNVDDIKSDITGGNGLAVIHGKVNTAINEVNANEVKIDSIKSQTNTIESKSNTIISKVDTIKTAVDSKPEMPAIQSAINTQTDQIKGPGNRNLTDVYNNERGTDNALLSNDPRLAFLDAAISSRSNFTVADIWSNATRTLTSSPPLSNVEVAKIWDYLVSNITTSGSIGKYILDMLDTKVSGMSTLSYAQLLTALAPLALESTVQTVYATVVNENNQNEVLIKNVRDVLNNSIRPQTDKIVSDGAQQGSLKYEIDQNQSLIEGIRLVVDAIKPKTDLLHGDIAHQSTVVKIPINPLRDNDSRLTLLNNLTRLDVPVSTRATGFPADYAKDVELEAVKNNIIAEININEAKINQLPSSAQIDTKLVRLDNILVNLSDIKGIGFDKLLHSLVKIKEGQSGGTPGVGATPQQIWEYTHRTLTQALNFATPEDVESSTNDILHALPEYRCHMTTTFITSLDTQEVLCWLDSQGQTLPSTTNARVVVSNGQTDIWSGTSTSPDSRGVFRITKTNISSLINTADRNFIIAITINHGGRDYRTVQPFYTVG